MNYRGLRQVFMAAFMLTMLSIQGSLADDSKTVSEWLTGGSKREWIKVRWEQILGPHDACRKGELWEFSDPENLSKKICKNKKPIESKEKWETVPGESDHPLVVINGVTYEVEMAIREKSLKPGRPKVTILVTTLRTLRKNKDEKIEEIELIHYDY